MDKLYRQLQVELDSAYLYGKLSEKYQDELVSRVLKKMSEIENHHAQNVLSKIRKNKPDFQLPPPSLRARIQIWIGQYIGYDFLLGNLSSLESRMSHAVVQKKLAAGEKLNGLEHVHLQIIQNLSQQKSLAVAGGILSQFEGKHKTAMGGNALRAAVLGANDGLVSNLSLVMGVAGALSNNNQIVLAGVAGLLAGGLSMALGEWVSVQSARELYERQVEIEAEEIATSPEEEMQELALLYQARGIPEVEAIKMAEKIFENKEMALESLVKEELGIDNSILEASPWSAAFASLICFVLGAFVPLCPFFVLKGFPAIVWSVILSTLTLFSIGGIITIFTGRSFLFSAGRQTLFGLTAALITFLIGKWIGSNFLF